MGPLSRPYLPMHEVTKNFAKGMALLNAYQLSEALTILRSEPIDSPCYGLAVGNIALILLRQEKYAVTRLFFFLVMELFPIWT